MDRYIAPIIKRIYAGGEITREEAQVLINRETGADTEALIAAGQAVFKHFCSDLADMCALINAKSGSCGEDCRFCAQSEHYAVEVPRYPLLAISEIIERAKQAESFGAHRFCIVTSGGSLSADEFQHVLDAYRAIRSATALKLDGSLGLLSFERIQALRDAGVTRVNHNLETSRDFFPHVCSTHSFDDRYNTVKRLKQAGLEVCCGGIIGLGESRNDRLALAFSLKELAVDSIPVNILNPRPGTPFERNERLSAEEIIKTIALFRLINPQAVIKIAGGREVNLGTDQERALRAGANGIIIGGYLTTQGNPVQKDIDLVKRAGLRIS
jgi:biotin synthase